MASLSNATGFGKRVFSDFSEKNVTFMAAGLAYNAFVSLVPLLLLLFLALTLLGTGLQERILAAANQYLPGAIAGVVEQAFQQGPASGGASIIGLVVLLWGALKIFRGLDTAFSEIYETVDDNTLVDKMKDGLVVLFALGAAVVATVGASAVFGIFADVIPFSGYLTSLVLLGGLIVAFLPMYYVFPDVDVGLWDVLPGAVFAAVGWAAFQALFQVYLSYSDPSAGSIFGGVIVVVTYLYFSSVVLLLGAVINAVSGEHSTGKPGGVGQGATSFEVRRQESLDRGSLGAYLRGLHEQLTHSYDAAGSENGQRPRPDGDVDLVEYVSEADDESPRQYKVELSWEAPPKPRGESEAREEPGVRDEEDATPDDQRERTKARAQRKAAEASDDESGDEQRRTTAEQES